MATVVHRQTSESDSERNKKMYYQWLCQTMHVDNWRGKQYYELATLLHNTTFYATIPLDENRVKDGIRLRSTWVDLMYNEADALGIAPVENLDEIMEYPCSVLEALVAMSLRLESDIMQDDDIGPRGHVWFWMMIQNLGLDRCDDEHLFLVEDVDNVISHVLERQYNPDGSGGLFPLMQPSANQMFVDMWGQAQAWLREQYGP